MNVTIEQLVRLQSSQGRIRNMCILAHVDHGKTTLSDNLIAANGLIHPKMVGEMRYLDSRDDEQERGITMKSSSISLLYVPGAALRAEGPRSVSAAEKEAGYLVNLIDSPGHVDFCSEVSTAARLCDGALVVVDAVEGVCIQTHAVLRQAWNEKVKPCLMINKLDRLIVELRLTPAEAYARLQAIVAHVNMIMSAFASEHYLSEADAVLAYEEAKEAARAAGGGDEAEEAAEEDHDEDVFRPEVGNVAFGSAHDGWAFRTDQFAAMYAEKLGCKPEALRRCLWGDWAFSAKEKKVVRAKKKDGSSAAKQMFVQFALEPIWKAYSCCDPGEDVAAILGPIVKGRNLKQVPARALEGDARQALRSVLRAWLPLSEAVLGMAVEHMPSPQDAAPNRLPKLMAIKPGQAPLGGLPEDAAAALARTESGLLASSSAPDAPLVIYVSKMISVPASLLPRLPGDPAPASQQEEVFLAFGRVFSGVARAGGRVHVLSSAYDPSSPQRQRQTAVLKGLFLMMGRALERLDAVPAGNVLAIFGLETAILKSATLASSPACRPLAPMTFQAAPIVRVAVEPAKPSEMGALVEGLRLLNRADPFVEVSVMDSGEHVLSAAGEVHLETCVKDLRERFARVELLVSPPLVAFRETVFRAAEAPEGTTAKGARVAEASTPNGACTVRVRAWPLPSAVAAALDESSELLRRLLNVGGAATAGGAGGAGISSGSAIDAASAAADETAVAGLPAGVDAAAAAAAGGSAGAGADNVTALRERLTAAGAEAAEQGDKTLAALLQRAWILGPKRLGPNLLLARPAPGAAGGAAGPSLFDVPQAQVVKVAKNAGLRSLAVEPTTSANGAAANGGPEEDPAAAAASAGTATEAVDVSVGFPDAAIRLGLADSAAAKSAAGCNAAAAALPGWAHVEGSLEAGLVAGFQMATAAGPLCEEPMWGVAFEVDVRLNVPAGGGEAAGGSGRELALQEEVYGPFSGQVMTTAAAAFRRAVLEADPRLVEAAYLCEVQTSAEALSGVYAVLGRRRARVLREEMKEGSDQFLVHAYLPVEASFGLADEMRRRCSGAAAASLMLSHWERLQVDPFFVPTTEEEREEWGEEAGGAANLARRLIDAVRRRKGLPVEEKVVKVATKQRTLKRNV